MPGARIGKGLTRLRGRQTIDQTKIGLHHRDGALMSEERSSLSNLLKEETVTRSS